VWRICVGLSLVPCFATLYQRLTLPEATRYNEAQSRAVGEDADIENKKHGDAHVEEKPVTEGATDIDGNGNRHQQVVAVKKVQFMGMSVLTNLGKEKNLVD